MIKRMKIQRGIGLLALALTALAAGCGDESSGPFQATGSGSVEGRLYLDADRNATFNPVGGDVALSGVGVAIRVRGSTDVLAGATAVTDANGLFSIASVPPGTHELYVSPDALPAGATVCLNPQPLTVYIDEVAGASIGARNGCRIDISVAESKSSGEAVTVSGIVTAAPGMLGGANMYVQDATGGLQIFGITDTSLQIGDLVEISGTLAAFRGEWEVTNPKLNSRETGVGAPAPLATTTKALADAGASLTHPLIGRLAKVHAAKLTSTFSAGGGRNATIDDGSGGVLIRIESGVINDVAALNTTFKVGTCYDFTGIASVFDVGELRPRTTADWQEVPCS